MLPTLCSDEHTYEVACAMSAFGITEQDPVHLAMQLRDANNKAVTEYTVNPATPLGPLSHLPAAQGVDKARALRLAGELRRELAKSDGFDAHPVAPLLDVFISIVSQAPFTGGTR